jgi:SAM-dependent methyltransferase
MDSYKNKNAGWDKLYAIDRYVYGTSPNRYLQEQAFRLRSGMKALAIGDGEGRNGTWLASQGLKVVSIDLSPVGIEKARKLAHERNVSLTLECCNLLEWTWPLEEFDLVAAIYLQLCESERLIVHGKVIQCLKKNGLLVLEAFQQRHQACGRWAKQVVDTYYSAAILEHDFRDLEIIELLEQRVSIREGFMHRGEAEVVRLIAQKPLQNI